MKVLHEMPLDEIAEIEDISRRCGELHVIGPMYATLEMHVRDLKTGVVLSEYADLCRSLTRTPYNIIAGQAISSHSAFGGTTYGAGKLPCRDTAGANQSSNSMMATFSTGLKTNEDNVGKGWRGAVAIATHGIVVGTDGTAENFDDYKLVAPVVEGMGTGQMNYAAMAIPTVTWEVGVLKFKCVGVRVITNNSSSTITVNETGIYGSVCSDVGNVNYTACFVRDALASPVACDAASLLTVTYTLYSPALPA